MHLFIINDVDNRNISTITSQNDHLKGIKHKRGKKNTYLNSDEKKRAARCERKQRSPMRLKNTRTL